MITWIQVLLQKHHKVVFSILLAVIIVAFVFTIGSAIPSFSRDASGRQLSKKDFYGYNLDDQRQVQELSMIAQFDLRLANIPVNQNTLQDAVLKYAYLSYMAKSLCLNAASENDVKVFIQSRPLFQNADGSFNAENFKQFNDFLKLQGFDNETTDKLLSELVIADKMQSIIAGPGYVSKEEIELAYKDAYGKWDVSIAILPFETFKPEIKVEYSALETFYNLNKENFRVADAIGVDVVFFANSNFPSDIKNPSEEEIKNFFNKNLSKYTEVKDGKFAVKELKDVTAQVVEDMKKADSASKAFTKADEILSEMYDANINSRTPEFNKFIADKKLVLKSLPAVRKTDKTLPTEVPTEVAKASLKLSAAHFYDDPVATEDGVYIVFFRESKPSYIPELKDVKADVVAAFAVQEKEKAFSNKGAELKKALQEAVAKGGKASFAELAKAQGLKLTEIDSFAFADKSFRNIENYYTLNILGATLPKMKVGDVADMITVDGGGYIVYASKFTAPEKSATAEEEFKKFSKNAQNLMRGAASTSVMGKGIMQQLP